MLSLSLIFAITFSKTDIRISVVTDIMPFDAHERLLNKLNE